MEKLVKGQTKGKVTVLQVHDFPHPGDKHLQYCIVHRNTDFKPYVCYLYNSELDSFNEGHYCESLNDAERVFNKRVNSLMS